MKGLSLVFVSLLYLSSQKTAINAEITISEENEELYLGQVYSNMDRGLKNLMRGSIQSALRVFLQLNEHVNLSTNCMSDGFRLLRGMKDLNLWAINFLDASGKLNDGLLSGNNLILGNYDQCLNSTAYKKNGDPYFYGQYCLLSYIPYLFDERITPDFFRRQEKMEKITQNASEIIRFFGKLSELTRLHPNHYGICVPSGCAIDDLMKITKYLGKQIFLNMTVEFCHTEKTLSTTSPRWIGILSFVCLVASLAVIGTVLEQYSKVKNIKLENITLKILQCFSITSNFSKLMNTKVQKSNLLCIHGIKCLTLFYVVLGHTYAKHMMVFSLSNTYFNFIEEIASFFFQVITNGSLCVEVFFFIGGFLNSYIRIKNSINIPPHQIIIHRLWRIYPAYIFCILIFLLFVPRGPLSDQVQKKFIDSCATDGWRNLLFINNLFSFQMCLPHTWYLAADMQCFLISLVSIPFLMRLPKVGVFVNLAVVCFDLAYTAALIYMKNLPPAFIFTNISIQKMSGLSSFYFSPISHIPTYIFGILMGFYLSKNEKIKMSKITQILGWIVASSLFITNTFVTQKWNAGTTFSRIESVLYGTLSKPLHGLCIGWLLFCCITGHGGVINYILSMKLWIPLSRMSFIAYLISLPLQIFYVGNLRTTVDSQRMRMIWSFFGDLTCTCLLALAMTVLFESPFLALEKIIFPRRRKEDENIQETMKVKELEAYNSNVNGDVQLTSKSGTI